MSEKIKQVIRQRFGESTRLAELTHEHLAEAIARAVALIVQAYRAGGGVFLFGNGGSAADAQHIACELVGRFLRQRRALRAQALAANPAVLTAIANDTSHEQIFARQLEAAARPGDVAIALSTSGSSPNVVAGLKVARQMGLKAIAITGKGGGQCADLVDVLLDVPSNVTPRVQEVGTIIYHVICELVEEALAGGQDP